MNTNINVDIKWRLLTKKNGEPMAFHEILDHLKDCSLQNNFVYIFFYKNGVVVNVGQSKNGKKRLRDYVNSKPGSNEYRTKCLHHKDNKMFIAVVESLDGYDFNSLKDRLAVERLIQGHHMPIMNI